MQALVYQAPGQYALADRSEPRLLAATEAIVQITPTTIGGLDWHILNGEAPAVTAGVQPAHRGVLGQPIQLNLDQLWDGNITLTTSRVTTPVLTRTVMVGAVKPRQLITHHFPLGETMQAYDAFGHAVRERALKIVIQND